MARKTNLNKPRAKQHKNQVKTYGTQTPLSSAAVERGSTRWLSGSHVEIQGTLSVTGTATVGGTLSVTGTFNASGQINLSGSTSVTGPMTISGTTTITGSTNIMGELNVTGPTTLDGVLDIGGDTTITGTLDVAGDTEISGNLDITGDTSITGTLGIEGVTTLKNDLNVESGGRIKAGQVEIHPNDGGNIAFDNGGITSGGTGFRFTGTGGRNAVVESVGGQAQLASRSSIVAARAGAIDLTAAQVHVSERMNVGGRLQVAGSIVAFTNLPETSFAPNLHITSAGVLYRTTWTP